MRAADGSKSLGGAAAKYKKERDGMAVLIGQIKQKFEAFQATMTISVTANATG